MEWKLRFYHFANLETRRTLWFFEKPSALFMKFIFTKQTPDPVGNYSNILKNPMKACRTNEEWQSQPRGILRSTQHLGNKYKALSILFDNGAFHVHKETPSTGRRRSALFFMPIRSVEVIWRSLFPEIVTTVVRHFDPHERDFDGLEYCWEANKSVLWSSNEVWLQMIFQGSSDKGIEYCTNKDEIFSGIGKRIKGILELFPIETEFIGCVYILPNCTYIPDLHGCFSPYWRKDWFQEGRRKTKFVKQSFKHWRIFTGDLEEDEQYDDSQVLLKPSYVTKWKYDHNAVYRVLLSKAQDQGIGMFGKRSHLQSWFTLRYLEIVLISWHLRMENELISKDLKFLGRYLR